MTNASGRKPADLRVSDRDGARTGSLRWGGPVREVAFFAVLFAFLWLWVQPVLIYDCGAITNFPVFYKGWPFFFQTVRTPGGFVQYAAAFLSQLFYYSWAGAAVITLQIWATCLCTGYLLRKADLPAARLLRFAPAIVMLVAYAGYSYHFPLFLGVLACVAFASMYAQSAGRSRSDIGVFLGLLTILYLAGAAASLSFAASCAAYELRRRRWRQAGLYPLVAAVLPYVLGVLILRISVDNAYTELLPFSWRIVSLPSRERLIATVYVAYLLPVAGVLAGALRHLWRDRRPEPAKHKSGFLARSLGKPVVSWTLGTIVLFAVGGGTAWLARDAGRKALLEIHHYACRRMWPQVLDAARHCPADACVINAIDRALYHQGRLGQDLFLYAQEPEALVVTGSDHIVHYWHTFDTLMDLGLVNQAEKNLTECLEAFGEQPMILKRLATVNMVKGRTEAARVYLGALRKTLFHSRWAGEQLARLDADPSLSSDPEIQRMRVRYYRPDSIAEFYDRDAMLTALVGPDEPPGPQPASGGRNRMAFEYLLAWRLLTGQLGRVAQQAGRMAEFGYTEIPPLCQEAILIYAYGTGRQVDLRGLSINPEIERQFKNFSAVVNRYGANRAAAIPELARDYRGSYFFYYFNAKVANR
ncbi:MAG: hypothetical protein GX448_00420 [Planctomycetes bacterium]|nr:hypothetical protein [Planctomycetota bacterium]